MVSQKSTLSASNIKYLLAMRELNMEPRGVRSTDLARSIGVTKPSVYTMAKSLCSLGLVEKDRYGAIRFTQDGEDVESGMNDITIRFVRAFAPCFRRKPIFVRLCAQCLPKCPKII